MPSRHTVIVTEAPYFSEAMRAMLREADADIRLSPCFTEEEVISQTSGAEVIVTTKAKFPRKVLERLPECRFILRCGIGLDNFDLRAATERGILIATLPDWYHEDLTDHIVAFILNSTRKVNYTHHLVKQGKFSYERIYPIHQLKNQVLGIIGFGKIPRFLLPKLLPFKFRILVYDPYTDSLPKGLEKVDLDSLLKRADIISINCPLNEETRGLIGERAFSLMKPGAYIINTARGGIIDEHALLKALRENRIAGAALDVFSQEPPPPDHPILQFENVMITPHMAWYSEEALEEARTRAAEEVVGFFKGKMPGHPANPEAWTSSQRR
jgi:D-3-phosphoglycerate dehydrogenase / 2-oxoglutarate reductase